MGLFTTHSPIAVRIEIIANLAVIKNWQSVHDLCQYVNNEDNGAKEAARVLRKKLRTGTPQQQLNVISIIQSLIDGCGSKFKANLATEKFAAEISQVLISQSTNPHVKSRLMERLSVWSRAFSQDPGLAIIPQLHKQMLCLGIASNAAPNINSAAQPSPHPVMQSADKMVTQILQDTELAKSSAQMLIEAISFADPEIEAIEENELIKEFHSKCFTLHRGIQIYLQKAMETPHPHEECLAALLSCNEELLRAFAAHTQMLQRCQQDKLSRANSISHVGATTMHSGSISNVNPSPTTHTTNSAGQNETTIKIEVDSLLSRSQDPSVDPFADDVYRVSDSSNIATAIRNGKRVDVARNSDEISEKELLELIKSQSPSDSTKLNQAGPSSSSAATPASIPAVAVQVSPAV
ncbi:putative actin patch assembly and actin polymerization protein [Lobosporangium transversale]|uniref:VHS domain-containing protein n=1 Tax=Lobosporangium transversale TaxID=64571 RepID=A0A1Y2G6E9_9FUNG|nr:hypothetical protein BCR41DRAFT_390557 [Lobosporangium transversale]KAF9910618.1 putative actin patch assembly and actin polymerization protein [Lobosporangium transversale]ORY98249.1 hypothetical protein BCR41DRAFT_390557 [Lobosporangium transversale]|eukprot:XP_021875678.1 hypothetical protein BCR41DRAFT_390557 [Lobosporangium transversale]